MEASGFMDHFNEFGALSLQSADDEGGIRDANSCTCKDLRTFKPIILIVTVPIIVCYSALIALGVSNVIRFRKVRSMS